MLDVVVLFLAYLHTLYYSKICYFLKVGTGSIASETVISKSRGYLKGKSKYENTGDNRKEIAILDGTPLMFNIDKCIWPVDEGLIREMVARQPLKGQTIRA